MAAARLEEVVLALVSIPLIVLAGAFFLFGQHIAAFLFAALIALVILATYYARRPRITHRPARVLRAVFYTSFTYPGDKRAPRLSLRLSVIVVVSILLGLFARRW